MIQEKFDNEEEIRRFLFGEMNAGERAAFEERFIAEDADLFERIGVVEDELIESYVRETLSAAEKTKFEKSFLTTEKRRERVAFTRAMFDKLAAENKFAAKKTETAAANPPVWTALVNFFKTPHFALGAGFALLFLIFGIWFLALRNPENPDPIARLTPPTPTASETPQKAANDQSAAVVSNVNSANNAEANKTPAAVNAQNSNKPEPKTTISKPVVATLALFAGTVRSGGARSGELNITKDVTGANFVLNLESPDYKIYRAEIVDADGRVVYRSGRLTAQKSAVNAFFPTARLKKGDYFVKLYGFNAAGEAQSAADFQFRVNRK